jgi:hypothetical protein
MLYYLERKRIQTQVRKAQNPPVIKKPQTAGAAGFADFGQYAGKLARSLNHNLPQKYSTAQEPRQETVMKFHKKSEKEN